ncbi:MAG TPA: hypothetical protein VMZ27_00665, partial [Candidatus Saccharimonadales bacterium]|nr:hypothetical protein [Candidatus Saccharimonadales bacterium]
QTPVAYETLLLDAMRGDAMLFTRRDEIEAQWSIITPIEDAWKKLPAPVFPNYPAGSEGPVETNELIGEQFRGWHALAMPSPALQLNPQRVKRRGQAQRQTSSRQPAADSERA